MVAVEKALRDSIKLYKKNPVSFFLPHFVETILTLVVLISMAVTMFMAIGVHFADITIDDPYLLLDEIGNVGIGLIAILLATILLGFFLIFLIKAGALAGVVGMARSGFSNEKVAFKGAIEDAKKYTVDILLFWIVAGLIFSSLFALAFIPAVFLAVIGLSQTITIGVTFLAVFIIFLVVLVFFIAVMFTPQYLVVSKKGVFTSMKNSFEFVKNNIGAVIIYVAVIFVFNLFLFGFFGILSLLSDLFYQGSDFVGLSFEIFLFFLRAGVTLVFAPFFEMVKTRMIMDVDVGKSENNV
jgi:hypothetical protein